MNWIDLIWAVAPAAVVYVATRAEVARLRKEIAGQAAHITRLEKENAHLDARARRYARRADVMTAAALTPPAGDSIAALTADRIRAESGTLACGICKDSHRVLLDEDCEVPCPHCGAPL